MSTVLPDPSTEPELFDGVLSRRVMAYIVDIVIIFAMAMVFVIAAVIMGFLTLGLAWITIPVIGPIAVFIYYAATLGSPQRATIGMRTFDIVLTPTSGPPLDGWKALLHPFVFWVTIWIFWPLLFLGLFTRRRQLLHDLITSTLMVRRSPMEAHWARHGGFDAGTV